MSPCHWGSAMPGSTSPGLHDMGHGLHVTWQLHVSVPPRLHWAPCHPAALCPCVNRVPFGSMSPSSSMSLCHLGSISPCHWGSAMPGSTSPGLHDTICHLHSMSPGLYIIVSPASSISLCHLGSTGLHITRAPCHCVTWAPCHPVSPGSSVSPWFHNAWFHVTRAPCPYVTWVPLGSTSPGLHVTWTLRHRVTQQLHVTTSPCLHITRAPCHCVTLVPHHPVSPGSSMSPCHCGSTMPGSTSPGLCNM